MNPTQAGKRLGAVVMTLMVIGAWLGHPAPASAAAKHKPKPKPEPALEAVRGPYIVADLNSGRVIAEFDALRPWYPASTTKLMTIYVAFEAVGAGEIAFDSLVRYSANAANQPASKMGFKPGTTLTLDNALKMMMVKSANDIAVAVAETVGGSVAGFSNRMNDAAKRLGMTRSHFVNPNGLPDENQYTSARDMALLARALHMEFRQYDSYLHLPAIEIGGRILKNFNSLLVRYPGATGMKTGFICASGFNLVASAKRGEREVIAVVFGEYGGKARTQHAAKLLDQGFDSSPPVDGPIVRLADAASGANYSAPLDMRPYVCGPRRVRVASEADEEGDDEAGALTEQPIDLGPPIKVSALVPVDYGEPGFVARLPRPRPGAKPAAGILNAYAPGEEGPAMDSTDAIGAAAGNPRPLDEVAP